MAISFAFDLKYCRWPSGHVSRTAMPIANPGIGEYRRVRTVQSMDDESLNGEDSCRNYTQWIGGTCGMTVHVRLWHILRLAFGISRDSIVGAQQASRRIG